MRKFPEVMFIVDIVSSFSTESIPMDALGIDVLLTGSQKALALPPGLTLFSFSERALERAQRVHRARLLFRLPGIRQESGARYDAEHACDSANLRLAFEAR